MPSALRSWKHSCQQFVSLEYASLKQRCPEGVYLTLKSGSSTQWFGVLFVRRGPYAPAILRFQILFPPDYPFVAPSITFTSDIFHPLVAPLTTYTYTTGSSSAGTVSATDEERLSPGGFSLRHGFPHWFGHAQKSAASSETSSRNVSESHTGQRQVLRDAIRPPPSDSSSRGSSVQSLQTSGMPSKPTSIIEVLEYVKRAFSDESTLDTLPLEDAGNLGAWKAWRAHRRGTNSGTDTLTSDPNANREDEWSWDGVWEERVRKGLETSVAESTLYSVSGGDDSIHFADIDKDVVREIVTEISGLQAGS